MEAGHTQILGRPFSVRERARRVFACRFGGSAGPRKAAETETIWQVKNNPKGPEYKINRSHPAVKALLSQAPGFSKALAALIVLIEAGVPVQRIWPAPAAGPEPAPEGLRELLLIAYENRRSQGFLSPAEIKAALKLTEQFNQHPELIDALPDG